MYYNYCIIFLNFKNNCTSIPLAIRINNRRLLYTYNINVRVLGEEYKEKDFTGKDICKQRDISLYFNKRDHRFSSTELRQRVNTKEMKNESA